MGKRKTPEDYRKLAESKGFVWVGKQFPTNVYDKTTWRCAKGHFWEAHYHNIDIGRDVLPAAFKVGLKNGD